MTQFHVGQKVKVWIAWPPWGWRKDGIVSYAFPANKYGPQLFNVEFSDYTKETFAADHIRAVDKVEEGYTL